MTELNFSILEGGPEIPEERNESKSTLQWHYIVEYIVDLRVPEDPQILNYVYITLRGDMDSDMYFSECVCNAQPDDFLPTEFTGHLNLSDTTNMDVSEPGVYRLTFGVTTQSSKTWTDCGYEYDAWEEYDLIAQYKFTNKEIESFWDTFCNVDGDDWDDNAG